MSTSNIVVVKIGGSTLGNHDTTLEDLVTIQSQGLNPVVVHGGGQVISQWLEKQGHISRFVRGLRVTDQVTLETVVAVLAGLVNKEIVSSIIGLGGKAIGISGVDGNILKAQVTDPELGMVGTISHVHPTPIHDLLDAGYIPVVAPVALNQAPSNNQTRMLNINADTVAGELARAITAYRIIFLTDVEGVLDDSHRLISRLTSEQAQNMITSGSIDGGMIPKVEACLIAAESGAMAQILDGRAAGALSKALNNISHGSQVG